MAKVRFERCDDWVRLFIDGKCVDYGHEITNGQLLELLGIDYEELWGEFEGGGGPNDTFTPDE